MADSNYEVGIRIKATSDDGALNSFEKSLQHLVDRFQPAQAEMRKFLDEKKLLRRGLEEGKVTLEEYNRTLAKMRDEYDAGGQAAAEASAKTGGFKEAMLSAGKAVVGMFALERVASFLWDAAKGAAEEARTLNQLSVMIAQFDSAAGNATATVEAFAEAMAEQGVVDDQVYEGIRKLIPAAGSLENAINGTKLALDVFSSGLMSYEEALGLVADLVAGKDRGLANRMKALGISATDTDDALKKMFDKFGGYTEKIQDQQTELDKLSTRWADFKDEIGGPVLNALMHVGGVIETIFRGLASVVVLAIGGIREQFAIAGAGFSALWEAISTRSVAPLKRMKADIVKAMTEASNETEEALRGIWDKSSTKDQRQPTKPQAAPVTNPDSPDKVMARYEAEIAGVKATAKSYEELEQKVAAVYKRMATDAKLTAEQRAEANEKALKSDQQAAQKAGGAKAEDPTRAVVEAYEREVRAIQATCRSEEELEAKTLDIHRRMAKDVRLTADQRQKASVKVHAAEVRAAKDAEAAEKRAADEARKASADRLRAEEAVAKEEAALAREGAAESVAAAKSGAQQREAAYREMLRRMVAAKAAEKRAVDAIERREVAEAAGDDRKVLAAHQRALRARLAADRKYSEDVEKLWADANRRRVDAEKRLYGQLKGLMSEYGGKTGETVAKVLGTVEELYAVWGTISDIFHAKEEVKAISGAVTAVATEKTKAVAEGSMQVPVWAINAASAVASTPFVGPALAIAAAAAAEAEGAALVAQSAMVPALASGGLVGAPTLALIGEAGAELVMPARFTRMFDAMSRAYEAGGTTNISNAVSNVRNGSNVTVNQNLLTGADSDRAWREVRRRLPAADRAYSRTLFGKQTVAVGSSRRVK